VVWRGRVESIGPATGAKYALLPPDNATGNFTKVVQRVPVRIAIDMDSEASGPSPATLPVGLSVGVSVRVD
jgi:membrane fusion protein (multidrug efflux system)